jgi:hypothetical protein
LKKKKAVKEGSPFEEEYLIELLKDIKMSAAEKEEVQEIMRALLFFGQVDESIQLHSLLENQIKLAHIVPKLTTVE